LRKSAQRPQKAQREKSVDHKCASSMMQV
jgi:hypothetical protein